MTSTQIGSGYTLGTKANFTNHDLLQLCQFLNRKFNDKYETDEYSFLPERITEGGIIWDQYPKKEGYKTMRIFFNNYPFVDELYKEETILIHDQCRKIPTNSKNTALWTRYKAFQGAPLWTQEELILFNECFEEIGLEIKGRNKKIIV